MWKHISEAAQRKEKQKWAIEKPKLDNARRLRGIYFIDPVDEEFKETINRMQAATPCKIRGEIFRKLVALRMLARQNTHASLKPTNLRENVWKELYTKIMKTILQGKELIHWAITILFTSLFLCPKQWKHQMRKQQWKKNGKNSRRYRHGSGRSQVIAEAWNLTKVRNKSEVIDEARKEGKKSSFCVIDGSLSSQEFGVGTTISKIQRPSCAPRWQCQRWFRIVCIIDWAGIIGITNDSCKSNGCHSKATRMRRTSSRRSISWNPGHSGRCTIVTSLFLCLKLWKFLQQKQRWTRNGKNWRKFRRGTWRKSEVREKWSMKRGRKAQKFILHHQWTYVIWKTLSWRQNTKNTKVELHSDVIL